LPDKAIDVLDEAGARVRLENRRLPLGLRSLMQEARGFNRRDVDIVTDIDISDVISNWTGIPVQKITGSESERYRINKSIIWLYV